MAYQHLFKLSNWQYWGRAGSYYENSKKQLCTLNLRKEGKKTFRFTTEHQHLTFLDLSHNNLEQLIFDVDMPHLEYLDISHNPLQLVDFKAHFPKLKYIHAYQSGIKSFTFLEDSFPVLDTLNLKNNQLSTINLSSSFDELVSLYLENNELKEIKLHPDDFPKLEFLSLQKNPIENSIIRGFVENEDNVWKVVKDYFNKAEEGGEALDNECKVLLIGNGKVGKSCFVERLVHNSFEPEWKSTHAIAIEQHPLDKYLLNLWDFGGQDIYHATHRLFMQSDSVYLLFWDWETENTRTTECMEAGEKRAYENFKLPYWLSYAKSQGKGSPCIVIQTKKGKHGEKFLPNQQQLKEQFGIIDFKRIESSIADGVENGYDELLIPIKKAVRHLKRRSDILNSCIELRQAIRDLQNKKEKLLSWSDYSALASSFGIKEGDAINPRSLLENWLVKTGVVYYRKGLMGDKIVLNQLWAIEAIYTLFNRQERYYNGFLLEKGKVTGIDLRKIWSSTFTESEQSLFIDFMLSCDLCFENTPEQKDEQGERRTPTFEERTFIVPQLLPDKDKDSIESVWAAVSAEKGTWYYRYRHEFLHYGIIQSFIVRAKELAVEQNIWKSGILLVERGSHAFVEVEEKEIRVRVTKNGKELLDKIIGELDKIQHGADDIVQSVSLDGESFVLLEKLERQKEERNTTIEAENGTLVPLNDLLLFLGIDRNKRFEEEKEDRMRDWMNAHKEEMIGELRAEIYKRIPKERPQPVPPKVEVEKRKILFLAANPNDKWRIQPDEELSRIESLLKEAELRDHFDLKAKLAPKRKDLQKALKWQPEILHFSGHGDKQGIYLTNFKGEAKLISTDALEFLFENCTTHLKIIVLNSCYSSDQAPILSELGFKVIGFNINSENEIPDDVSIVFASGLYLGLGEGEGINGACRDAKGAILIDFPEIKKDEVQIEIWENGEKTVI